MIKRDLTKERFATGLKLDDLVQTDMPEAVLEEVLAILRLVSPSFESNQVASAFRMVTQVFSGNHPAYRACNTHYHDLRHTSDAFLAMARLIHGAFLNGQGFDDPRMITALIASLFHDTGYIQERNDTDRTGAKYSLDHVERSMAFMKRHGHEFGLTEGEVSEAVTMIAYTDISREISGPRSSSPTLEVLGRLLNAADLMAQMADRTYLEKLLFLYHEYKEGQVGNYLSEVDLLRKTIGFYGYIEKRLKPISEKADRFMVAHFAERWATRKNLYAESILAHKEYLGKILAIPGADPRDHLHRLDIVQQVRAIYGPG